MESRTKTERDWYDKLYGAGAEFASSAIRDEILRSSTDFYREQIQRNLQGKRALEIGCGTGAELVWCLRHGASSVEGIDISEVGIAKSQEILAREDLSALGHAQTMDVEALTFASESFDLVLDREVLSSVKKHRCIEEVARVLNAGGKFIGIECLGHNPLFNLHRKLKERRGERSSWAVENILQDSDLHFLREHFRSLEIFYFHLLLVLAAPILLRLPTRLAAPLRSVIEKIDVFVLKIPGVRKLAFKIVFVASK